MAADIIKFSNRKRLGESPKSTTDMAMPLQIRRHTKRAPRRRGSVATRRALRVLSDDAGTMEYCLRCMTEVAGRNHDPRAIAELMEVWWSNPEWQAFNNVIDARRTMEFISRVVAEYMKRLPPAVVND